MQGQGKSRSDKSFKSSAISAGGREEGEDRREEAGRKKKEIRDYAPTQTRDAATARLLFYTRY